MRQGFFPGQLESLRELARDGLELHDYRRKSRRGFLALGLGAVAAGVGGYWFGTTRSTVPSPNTAQADPLLAAARELASQPDAQLLAGHPSLLLALERHTTDETLWLGYRRLVNLACGDTLTDAPRLADRLLKTLRIAPPPADLGAKIEHLRTLCR